MSVMTDMQLTFEVPLATMCGEVTAFISISSVKKKYQNILSIYVTGDLLDDY